MKHICIWDLHMCTWAWRLHTYPVGLRKELTYRRVWNYCSYIFTTYCYIRITAHRNPGSRTNIKLSSYQYRHHEFKDRTVLWPCNLKHGNPISEKTVFILGRGPGCKDLSCVYFVIPTSTWRSSASVLEIRHGKDTFCTSVQMWIAVELI